MGLEQENGLVGWCTGGRSLVKGGQRLNNTSLAGVAAWLEAVLGLAQFYCFSALLVSCRFLVFDKATCSSSWSDLCDLTCSVVDAIIVLTPLLWCDAWFHRTPLRLYLRDLVGLTRLPGRSALFQDCGMIAAFHSFGLAAAACVQMTTGRPLLSLSNYRAWNLARVLDVLCLLPLREEVLFRGIFLRRLTNRLNRMPRVCAAISAAVFGFYHLSNLRSSRFHNTYVVAQSLMAAIIGMYLALAQLRHGSLPLCLTCHVVNNVCASFVPTDQITAGGVAFIAPLALTALFYSYMALRVARELPCEGPWGGCWGQLPKES